MKRKKKACGIIILVLLVACLLATGEQIYANYNDDKQAFVYREELFATDYAGGFILIKTGEEKNIASNMAKEVYNFAGDSQTGNVNDGTWHYVYALPDDVYSKRLDVYIDHYGGAEMNGKKYDVREYVWKEGEGDVYINRDTTFNGNSTSEDTGGVWALNVGETGIKIHREFHFYVADTLGKPDQEEVDFKGILQLTDFDPLEGYQIPSDNLHMDGGKARVFVGPTQSDTTRPSVVYAQKADFTQIPIDDYDDDNNSTYAWFKQPYTWLGTQLDDNFPYWNCTIWAEVHGTASNPLEVVYVTASTKGSEINYYNGRTNINYFLVDNDYATTGHMSPPSSSTPQYSYFKPAEAYGPLDGDKYKGYTFSGWHKKYENGVLSEPVSTAQAMEIHDEGSITLYGKYTKDNAPINVTIDYWLVDNDHTVTGHYSPPSETLSVEYGSSHTPARAYGPSDGAQYSGYEFSGWYYDEALTNPVGDTMNLTETYYRLYGKYTASTPNKYRQKVYVSYETPDGGWTDWAERHNWLWDAGSTFSWSETGDGKAHEGTLSLSYTVTKDETHYLKWERKKYPQIVKVKSENADGTWSDWKTEYNAGHRYYSGFTWTLPATADGVYPAVNIPLYTVTEAKTHEILRYRNKYTVILEKGTGIDTVTGAGDYRVGQSVTINATLKNGYKWTNWTGTLGTVPDQKSTFNMPAENVTMKANGVPIEYTITYDLDGGTLPTGKTNPSKYTVETATFTLNNPVKTGYTFPGWTGSNGTTPQTSVSIAKGSTGNKSYKANWKANSYVIKFDGNGATSGTMADMSCVYGKAYTLTKNAYLRTGYTYTGYWNTKPDGSGTSYKDEASVKNLTAKNDDTVILYAQWQINESALKIDPNGGTWNGSEAVQTFTRNYNETLTVQPPTRVGYTCIGWEKSNPFYGTLTSDSPTSTATYTFGPIKDVTSTLTAKWQVNYYNLHLIAGYGIETVFSSGTNQNAEGKYAYGSEVTITAKELAGFHFTDWNGTLGTTEEQTYTFTMPANDVTMTANGEANSYVLRFHPNDGGEVTPIDDITVKYDETVVLPDGALFYAKYTLDGVNITGDVLSGAISLDPILLEAESEEQLYEMMLQAEEEGYDILDEPQIELVEPTGELAKDLIEESPENPELLENPDAPLEPTKPEEPLEQEIVSEEEQMQEPVVRASVRAVLDAYPSVFEGWALEENKDRLAPQWEADCDINVASIINEAGKENEDGAVITLYAIWDDCPWIVAEDLYYTLQEAQSGFITHDELMSHASAYDREDGSDIPPGDDPDKGTSFKVIDYLPEDFTHFTASGSVTETYWVMDSEGSTYQKMITVHIVDSTPQPVQPVGTTRFINEKYYYESYENGGLEDNSVWKTDPEYIALIEQAFTNSRNNTPILRFYFTHEEILQMKEFVRENGVGNAVHEDALQRFYDEFMAPNVVE